jgi:hypothetical protein
MKSLKEYMGNMVVESKKHPLLNKEIKTDGEFKTGDIVLYRDLLDKGDETAIMFVVGPRNGYVLVADIGTSLTLGSSHDIQNEYLFKIGEIKVKLDKYGECKLITGEMIEEIFDICEKAGLDCTQAKENERKRGNWTNAIRRR